MEFEYKIGEVSPILKEEIWEPSKMGIVGYAIRAIGAPIRRYDTNGKLVEIYKNQLRSEMGFSIADAPIDNCGCGSDRQLTHVLVSKSPYGVITHYYNDLNLNDKNREQHIETFGLNRFFAEKSIQVVLRYSISGKFDGYYYAGPIDVIERKFGETSEFVKLLKNYYSQKAPIKFAFKDFGNEAVSVCHIGLGMHSLPLDKKNLETEDSFQGLTEKVKKEGWTFSSVICVENGGKVIGSEVAHRLGKPHIFAKKDRGMFKINNFEIKKGEKFLLVDDLIISGTTLRHIISLVKEAGGEVVGVACLVDRTFGGGWLPGQFAGWETPELGVPMCALIHMPLEPEA